MTVNRIHKTYSIDPDTLKVVQLHAAVLGIKESRALDIIVEQWAEANGIETHKQPSMTSRMEQLEKRMEEQEMLLNALRATVQLLQRQTR